MIGMEDRMDVTGYVSGQLNRSGGAVVPYTKNYVGGVQLIEDSGFQPFSDKQPLNSTLNQVFETFREKTGFDVDSESLRDQFLERNPATRNAMNLYNALGTTFTSRLGAGAPIEDFLNERIETFIAEADEDEDGGLNRSESNLDEMDFINADRNDDDRIDSDEMKDTLYNGFNSLKNILNHFRNNPGTFVDMYA